jgi:exonuclease III
VFHYVTPNVQDNTTPLNCKKFPKINFSCQNVCSLNISKPGRKTYSKLIAATKSGADIVFLSDTRLNSNKQVAGVNDIEKKCKFLGYSLNHNSRFNSRGTAILISSKLKYTVEKTYSDDIGNILLMLIKIGNVKLLLGSVYGPNEDNAEFFRLLSENIREMRSDYVVFGGDWNTTIDSRAVAQNIDVLNMANIPSVQRSRMITDLCNEHGLTDPYRYLYPDAREFTYVPYAEISTNRSRIDFFLISNTLPVQCINCRIPHSVSSLMFDHKQVSLQFRRDNPYKKQTLNDTILKDADLEEIVNISVTECYINHLTLSATLSDVDIDSYRRTVGNVCKLQKELTACRLKIAEAIHGNDEYDRCNILRNATKNNLNTLPSLDLLQTLELSCPRDIFLETLIFSVKNSSLAHQHDFFKIRNAKRKKMENKITALKKDFTANAGEILRCERDLNKVAEDEMREEILKMHDFEQLNNEKITPYFLSLAKRPHYPESLCDVNKDDGSQFESKQERDQFIRDYFANTYKKLPDTVTDQSINKFLGEVANRQEVIDSKLNQEERERLEQDLTPLEFDIAIEKAKINSAPGIDSISNRFIKTFWHVFRLPLFDYARCCFDKGLLTENFRCAKIRLIPKKGDTSLLKNWRPISLLNCFYKLISRVISIRLKSVMDKITRVAQKGFSSTKYCQEVLIGIVDSINSLKYRNRPGALLSLDIKKAFDSTSHSYLQQVYKFFNFGPNFIRWLNLIGTNRKACVILENGVYSEFFDLERGNAQGDTTSPYIFNMGFQILLLKLTFDLQIEGLIQIPPLPANAPPLPATVSTSTRKVSAYADNATLIVKLCYNSLVRIKQILEEFGVISGLVCNVEKTTFMVIGVEAPIDQRIIDLGFTITDSVTILGLNLNRNGVMGNNFQKIGQKIQGVINHWRPFNLSLPGRISIAKCMMYSQINYLGCFIPIPELFVTEYDNMITSFVKGKLNIAKKRLYLPPAHGGLGLFIIDDFLDAQRCAWIKRCVGLDENWKITIYAKNYANLFNCKARNINLDELPITYAICKSFERVSNKFTQTNENFRESFIFENATIPINLETRLCLTRSMFTAEFFNQNAIKLYKLKYFFILNIFISIFVLYSTTTGIPDRFLLAAVY